MRHIKSFTAALLVAVCALVAMGGSAHAAPTVQDRAADMGVAAPSAAPAVPVKVVSDAPSEPEYAIDASADIGIMGLCNYSGSHPVIKKGSTGAAVVHAQCLLRNYHGHKISVDGVFGNGTHNAVVSFQKKKGLVADGIVGNHTWNALHNV